MKTKIKEIKTTTDGSIITGLFEMNKTIENLTNILINSDFPFILSLNAPWGTGKTTFVIHWQTHLATKNIFSYYFNAWENDYTKDAFASVLSEFKRLVETNPLTNKNGQFKNVISHSKKVMKIGLPLAARMITMGALDLDAITEKTIAEFWEKVVSEKLKEYESAKADLQAFRKALSDAVNSITDEQNGFPVFIFIDELDRCRPTFAIELLEVLKHFFNIDNICIIVSIDKHQLSESIKSIYGNGFNSVEYLKRFIDLEFNLEVKNYTNYVKMYIEKYQFNTFFQSRQHREFESEYKYFYEILEFLSAVYKPTLRDLEKIFTIISISLKMTPKDQYLYPIPIVYLSFMKVINPEKYKLLIGIPITDKRFLEKEYQYFQKIPKGLREYPIPTYLEFQLDVFLSQNNSINSKIQEFEEMTHSDSDDRIEFYLRLNSFISRGHFDLKQHILDKLEFTGKLVET